MSFALYVALGHWRPDRARQGWADRAAQDRSGQGRVPDRAERDMAWSAEPDRSGTGQVCAKPGSVVQYWAVQRQAEWNRAAPDRTRQCRKRPGRATNDRSVLGRARQNLTGPGMASRSGRGRREGQCQTVHCQAGQGRASLCTDWPWQIKARPGTWCILAFSQITSERLV